MCSTNSYSEISRNFTNIELATIWVRYNTEIYVAADANDCLSDTHNWTSCIETAVEHALTVIAGDCDTIWKLIYSSVNVSTKA